MIYNKPIIASLALVLLISLSAPASAKYGRTKCNGPNGCSNKCPEKAAYMQQAWMRSMQYNWHGNFVHSAYGQPIALVVPPTAELQTNWSWGAPSSRISRIDHQFGRDYPGPGPFGGSFNNTPAWPSNMHQFGVYYVRGPWYPTQR